MQNPIADTVEVMSASMKIGSGPRHVAFMEKRGTIGRAAYVSISPRLGRMVLNLVDRHEAAGLNCQDDPRVDGVRIIVNTEESSESIFAAQTTQPKTAARGVLTKDEARLVKLEVAGRRRREDIHMDSFGLALVLYTGGPYLNTKAYLQGCH